MWCERQDRMRATLRVYERGAWGVLHDNAAGMEVWMNAQVSIGFRPIHYSSACPGYFGTIPQTPSHVVGSFRRTSLGDLFTSPSEGYGGTRPLKAPVHTMQDSMYPTSQVFRSPRSFLFSVSCESGSAPSPLLCVQ